MAVSALAGATFTGGMGEARVTPVSELTERTVALFMMELDEAVERGHLVVVDLRHVTAVAPTALEAMAEASRYLRDHGGELRFEHATGHVQQLLDDLGFTRAVRPEVAA